MLAVDEDVTVHHELAGLCGGAGDAGTQHEGVEARLQIGSSRLRRRSGRRCGWPFR